MSTTRRAFLVRALLIYALMEEREQAGDLLICSVLSQTRGALLE